jgi:hypothetical protein
LYVLFVTRGITSHEKFWRLSWYEIGLYLERFNLEQEEKRAIEEGHWARFRIQWADFRNVNRGKSKKIVRPDDLIKLSFDQKERVAEYHEIDMDALKRRFGSKIKKKK